MTQRNITKVLGVDIFVEAPLNVKMPATIAGLTLKHVASRGTTISNAADAEILDVGWVCARYFFVPGEETKADEHIATLIGTLGKTYRWSSLIKLFEINGAPAFT